MLFVYTVKVNIMCIYKYLIRINSFKPPLSNTGEPNN